MKIAVIYNTSDYLLRFRTELVRSLQIAGWEVIAITPRDEATPRLREISVRWCEWKLNGQSLNPFKDFAAIVDLKNILQKERPDAILNFTIKPVLYGSIIAGILGVPRVVSMITGMGSIFLPGGYRRKVLMHLVHLIYRIAMNFNHKVLFQNEEDMKFFTSNKFIDSEKTIRINGSGVNLEHFSFQQENVHPGSFLLISRMIKEKGIRDFVDAARQIKQKYPHCKFTLVGPIDNNPGAITRDEIESWVSDGIIQYFGIQSDVRPFLSRSEVYVLPTYYLEGIPRSILEALSMGKPVITTDWRGCRDTVVTNLNGFLVPPKNVESLVKAMICYLEDPSLSSRHGIASRKMAEEKFNVNNINELVIHTLRK